MKSEGLFVGFLVLCVISFAGCGASQHAASTQEGLQGDRLTDNSIRPEVRGQRSEVSIQNQRSEIRGQRRPKSTTKAPEVRGQRSEISMKDRWTTASL